MKRIFSLVAVLLCFTHVILAQDTWTVAGSSTALNGTLDWDPAATENDMTSTDGVNYTLTVTNCTLEKTLTYEYKVCKDHAWDTAYPYDNKTFNVSETAVYTVVYSFNAETHEVSETVTKTGNAGEITHTYTVCGVAALCGSEWEPVDTANDMTLQADGTYQLVKTGVALAAGYYEYKVAMDHAWGHSWPSSNAVLTFVQDGSYDVTFTFEPANGNKVSASTEYKGSADIEDTYIVAGSSVELFGVEWDGTAEANKMTKQENGDWMKVYEGISLSAGTIEYKFVRNGSEWIPEDNMELVIENDGYYKVTFTYVYEDNEPMVKVEYLGDVTVAAPHIGHSGNNVGMSTTTEQATIHYTVDGSEPTADSAVYTDSITVERNMTIKAIALRDNWYPSQVTTFEVNWFKVANVEFAQYGNTVTLTTETEGATIRYTLSSSEQGEQTYTEPLVMTNDCTVEAWATRDGYTTSDTTRYAFHTGSITVTAPHIGRSGNRIGMSTATEQAAIHYTLDGSEPTAGSAVYTDSITVERNMTIKAIALRDSWYPSEVTTFEVDWFKVAGVEFVQEGISLTLTTTTESANIFYSISNSEASTLRYISPLMMTGNCTVEAWATRDGYTTSDTTRYMFHADGVTVAAPHIAATGNRIGMSTVTEQAVIHYTTDGSEPTAGSAFYTDSITVERNMTIKAIALRDNWFPSEVTTFEVNWFKVAYVEFAQEGNALTLSTATAGAAIYYTQSDNESGARRYTSPLVLTGDCTIEAWAKRDGYTTSDTTRYVFRADGVTVAAPHITATGNRIGMNTATEQAVIRYTTDGSEPTADSAIYTDSITVERNMTIKAIALRDNWYPSEVTTFEVDWFKVAYVEFMLEGNALTLSTATAGATIYYTRSDNEADTLQYAAPLVMAGDCTIEAWATRDGYTTSDTTRYVFHTGSVTVAAPRISRSGNRIGMSTATEQATIRYTTDGTEPTAESAIYTDSITVERNLTIKAIALRDNWFPSQVTTFDVNWFNVANVAFTQEGNTVALSTETAGAAIYYMLSDNQTGAQHYTEPLVLTGDCTIEAWAMREGYNPSDTTRFVFHADGVTCGNPVLVRAEGTNTVTASTSTEGAAIRYTTDGTNPTADSELFPEDGLNVERNLTIKAIALRDNWYPSHVTTFEVNWFKVANVEFTQEGNTVALATDTDGATIYYTQSDSEAGEHVYTDVLTLTGDCTIEAWATREGYTTSDMTRYEFHYTPVGVAEFDGLVATVGGELTLDDAFKSIGGRAEAAKTLAAIVWDKDEALTADMLAGLTANPNLLVYVNAEQYAPEGVQNTVVGGVCEQLVLTDVTAGNGNFFAPQAFTAQHAEYTHSYTQETPVGGSQGWETLTLPFTVQTVTHVTQGEIAPFAALNDEDDTRKPFWLYTTGAAGGIGFERAARVEAYRPYLIAMPNNSRYREEYRLNGEVTFAAENAEVQATTRPSAATGQHYTFMPTTLRVAAADSVYALNTQGEGGYLTGSLFVRNSRDVLPFECYVTAGQVQGAPRLLPVKDMMDATTDIADIMLHPSATAADGLYDLGGRKVRQAAKGAIHVQHGRKAMQKTGRLPVQK